ncbi:MAG: hypothetical protein HWE24_21270 [Oceanospirillaceae bacterium]|nr:hypothetical protein [Oceanospirillaceae bacterium]
MDKRLEKLYSITEIRGGVDTILKYSTSEEKEKLLEDYLNSYPKLYRRYQKQKDIIQTLDEGSLVEWWKLHSKNSKEKENLCKVIGEYKKKIKQKNKHIGSIKVSIKSLVKRNIELQNRIYHEEKVNKILKTNLKKFESNNGGVKTKKNKSSTISKWLNMLSKMRGDSLPQLKGIKTKTEWV